MSAELTAPAAALAASRVDLVELIREGIPPREFVPGTSYLVRGKRHQVPAPAGVGKSMFAKVVAVDVVEAGGGVAILDVENGQDEFARRLADILAARDDSAGSLADACTERLRYHAFPALRADWAPEELTAALAGVDLVIFDSQRLSLSMLGLAEDSNDDFSVFASALLLPLARAGIGTLTLDNTGWEDRDRARGASAKGDLNEVVYAAKVGEEFDRDRTGCLRLVRKRTRFTDLPGELRVPIGGGTYGPVEEVEPGSDSDAFRPKVLMERASKVIENTPGLSRKDWLAEVGGKRNWVATAIGLLVTEEYVRAEQDGREKHHYTIRPYREAEDDGR